MQFVISIIIMSFYYYFRKDSECIFFFFLKEGVRRDIQSVFESLKKRWIELNKNISVKKTEQKLFVMSLI